MNTESVPVLDGVLEWASDDEVPSAPELRSVGAFPEINRGERNALRAFEPFTEFEPLSKRVRIGLPSMHALVSKELAEQGPAGIFGPTFRLTDHGRELALSLNGLVFDR